MCTNIRWGRNPPVRTLEHPNHPIGRAKPLDSTPNWLKKLEKKNALTTFLRPAYLPSQDENKISALMKATKWKTYWFFPRDNVLNHLAELTLYLFRWKQFCRILFHRIFFLGLNLFPLAGATFEVARLLLVLNCPFLVGCDWPCGACVHRPGIFVAVGAVAAATAAVKFGWLLAGSIWEDTELVIKDGGIIPIPWIMTRSRYGWNETRRDAGR